MASFTMSKGPTAAPVAAFNTSRKGDVKQSAPVIMMACHFDETARTIKIFCSDGLLRECKIDRLPSLEAAKSLWTRIKKAGTSKKEVVFVAAGGFSPDKWFYDFS